MGCVNLSELDERSRPRASRRRGRGRPRAARRRGRRAHRRLRARGRQPTHFKHRRPGRHHHRRAPALPERAPPLPAADQGRGDRAGPAHRAGRPRGQGADDQLQPAPGGVDRQEVPGPGPLAARPDPGGHLRPDPRGREVRPPQGLQVLHLRHVLDPPGDPARAGEQGAHDPHPRAHRPARAQDRRAPSATCRRRLGREPTDEEIAARGRAADRADRGGARGGAHRHQPRPPAWARRADTALRRPAAQRRARARGGDPGEPRAGDAARDRRATCPSPSAT